MKKVYIVLGLDYRHKESAGIDERDITPYICRVFLNVEDAEKYITAFFKRWATLGATLEISKKKDGYIYAQVKDKSSDKEMIYGATFKIYTKEVDEELGKCDLHDDMYNPYYD